MMTQLLTQPQTQALPQTDCLEQVESRDDKTERLLATFELQAIRKHVAALKRDWSEEERGARAEMGKQRRQNLVDLLFGDGEVDAE